MDNEKKIEKNIAIYQELGKENKNINMAALMMSTLAQAQQDEIEQSKKKKAYLISVVMPPFGLFYAVRYFFSGKDDGKHVALMCVLFTVISLLSAWAIGALLLSGAGGTATNAPSALNVNVDDLRNLLR